MNDSDDSTGAGLRRSPVYPQLNSSYQQERITAQLESLTDFLDADANRGTVTSDIEDGITAKIEEMIRAQPANMQQFRQALIKTQRMRLAALSRAEVQWERSPKKRRLWGLFDIFVYADPAVAADVSDAILRGLIEMLRVVAMIGKEAGRTETEVNEGLLAAIEQWSGAFGLELTATQRHLLIYEARSTTAELFCAVPGRRANANDMYQASARAPHTGQKDDSKAPRRARRGRPRTTPNKHPEVDEFVARFGASLKEFCLIAGFSDDTTVGDYRRDDPRCTPAHVAKIKTVLDMTPKQFCEALAALRAVKSNDR